MRHRLVETIATRNVDGVHLITLSRPEILNALSLAMADEYGCAAEQVVDAGLAMELCPPDELLPRTMEHARTLAALPMESLRTTKELLVAPHRDAMKDAVRRENASLVRLADGPASREARAAYAERRAPDFRGL